MAKAHQLNVIVLGLVLAFALVTYGHDFAGGTGEPGAPYRIATAEQLRSIGSEPELLSKHFVLVDDIDLSSNQTGTETPDRALIAPDLNAEMECFQGTPFQGRFDGGGHVISGLSIAGRDYVGLFGKVGGKGRILNLGLVAAQVSETGPGPSMGRYTRWTSDRDLGTAPLVAVNLGVVANCYATGSAQGPWPTGGLVGLNRGIVSNSYSRANVAGQTLAGGLVGENMSGVIIQCYASGQITGNGETNQTGGLLGLNTGGTVVASFFLDPNDGGGPDNGLGTPGTMVQLQQRQTFNTWDFRGDESDGPADLWCLGDAEPPILSWQTEKTGLVWPTELTGMSLDEAWATIEGAGLSRGQLVYTHHLDVLDGRVIALKPNRPVARNTAVDILVSSGRYNWQDNPGQGSHDAPYRIGTAAELVALSAEPALWDACFVLTEDIDLTGQIFYTALLAPDVNDANDYFQGPAFGGSFDGQGHTIGGLTILAANGYVGLFGQIEETGDVRNVGLTDMHVVGRTKVFRPECDTDIFSHFGYGSGAGGIASESLGTISACWTTGRVVGITGVGGIAGGANYIDHCYSQATACGYEQIGGLAGYGSYVVKSYATGPVVGSGTTGGLVGSAGRIVSSFWNTDADTFQNNLGMGLSNEELRDAAVLSLNGWGSDPNWVINDGLDYPRLACQGLPGQTVPDPSMDWFHGQGTEQDPYRIATVEQIGLIGRASILWDSHFILTEDIDLTDVALRPIGLCRGMAFTTSFDGNGHMLSGWQYHDANLPNHVGLFGYIDEDASVCDIGLQDASIQGGDYVGVLAALNRGSIRRCFVSGAVEASGRNVGLLAARNYGDIRRCYTIGSVTGQDALGGLVGRHYDDGMIAQCYSISTIQSTSGSPRDVGALIGHGHENLAYSYYLTTPVEGILYEFQGHRLLEEELDNRDSFEGWDFFGGDTDGYGQHWYMPPNGPPVLSWQTQITGLRRLPRTTGLPLTNALSRLEEAGFHVESILYDHDRDVPADHVFSAAPRYYAYPGDDVTLYVSQGPYNWATNEGNGTSESPYRIESGAQLEAIATIAPSTGKQFVLACDITLDRKEYTEPFSGYAFGGVLDGRGHAINNYTGWKTNVLGAIRTGGVVRNLHLHRAHVIGNTGGVLARYNSGQIVDCSIQGFLAASSGLVASNDGTIDNCSVDGTVSSLETVWGWGGIAGTNSGLVRNCTADVVISLNCAFWGAGAIVGENNGTIQMCSATAQVSTVDGGWGVAGIAGENNGTVDMCCATTTIAIPEGTWYVGGLVGQNNEFVQNCWAALAFSGSFAVWDIGGLVGDNAGSVVNCWAIAQDTVAPWRGYGQIAGFNTGTLANCYYRAYAINNGLGTPLTGGSLYQRNSYEGWDFEDIWMICEGQSRPRLQWEQIACDGL